ncbi:HPP family protein [Lacibacterium aquatile]|uniref:HPP family protein n=1 Tax=Lacibacterium aquatile TaxID=1168082 RepID=A0ABW5DXE8_9PROT
MSLSILRELIPDLGPISAAERLRACIGALIGILITGTVAKIASSSLNEILLLIAPMGASAVLLFTVPASPLAQPWSILGGNVASAVVGVICAKLIGDPLIAAAVAGGGAIAAMLLLRCLHPPGGAVALTAVLGGPSIQAAGFGFAFWTVGLNSLLLLLAALAFNNLTGRRYPHLRKEPSENPHRTSDPLPLSRVGLTTEDLDQARQQLDHLVDVDLEDLEAVLRQAERNAHRRRFGTVRCGEIMSRDVVTIPQDAPLHEAWDLLCRHHLRVLPVIGTERRVVGLLTQEGFLKHVGWSRYGDLRLNLRWFFKASRRPLIHRPHIVAQIMEKIGVSTGPETPIVDMVPYLSDTTNAVVLILDQTEQLLGIVGQSDIIAALYGDSVASP